MADKAKKATMRGSDAEEVAHFSRIAEEWWDERGAFALLHRLNPLRVSYIREKLSEHRGLDDEDKPLANLSLLDMGCGGGLVSEAMARLGADVTALDASAEAIKVAKAHAAAQKLKINYQVGTDETLKPSKPFDVILALELVEHVPDMPAMINRLSGMLAPSGLLFLSTINRTLRSLTLMIVGLEYLLRWLPRGTHDFEKFITPAELRAALENNALAPQDETGVIYNPLSRRFILSRDMGVNYMMLAEKPPK